MNNLFVSEIYSSYQGEGPNIGKPSIFLRTQFCPVGCIWCDSQYTWTWSKAHEMSDHLIMEKIRDLTPIRHIVFTGGEPFAQLEAVERLTRQLTSESHTIEFETSGTYPIHSYHDSRFVRYTCSPKLFSARTNIPTKPDVIKCLRDRDATFKFVVQDQKDLDEVMNFIEENDLYTMDRIYLMPQATTRGELEERLKWLLEEGAPQIPGVRVSNRLHIQVWGMQRKR